MVTKLRFPTARQLAAVAALVLALFTFETAAKPLAAARATSEIIVGKIRVQLLSDSLVRLEEKGARGFEDRLTFHVVNRDWPGVFFQTNSADGHLTITTARYRVSILPGATTLKDVRVESANGEDLFRSDGTLENSKWLPGPSEHPEVWSFADAPRVIPAPWGLAPAPANSQFPQTSGWDLGNDAPDVYVFIPGGDYYQLRRDFLKLTGPTEMIPLYALGAFDSRWYDYTEATALKQIDDYRAHRVPLDVLAVDTGWRRGASSGYLPNTNLFPDMARFFREAHARNVRVLFNDHPDPVSKESLAPEELNFRYSGLSGLLNQGLDVWWYDRNWRTALVPPAPNLRKEVWGMRLYHDMTQRAKPGLRPMIMANVDGIDNGIRKRPPNVAAHRFPIQWTGDIHPDFEYLRYGVENAVHSGVQALFPYMSEDLGGHVADPSTEGYIRWIEYGALSPIYRPHCTHNLERMPWAFGPEAERVARRFLDMRYRLLPVWYAAARQNYETGEPLLRRLDLDFPQFPEAARDDEYLVGKAILVAPVLHGSATAVPAKWLSDGQNQIGLAAEYFNNERLEGAPVLERVDNNIDFNWGNGSPTPAVHHENFSARWTGTITVPESTGDATLAAIVDDGVRVWVDDKEIIDAWGPHDSTLIEATSPISAGKPHRLRIEYQQLAFKAALHLLWHSATNAATARSLWLPPGDWIYAWTGKAITGPATVTHSAPLDQIPIYIRSGTILPLAPEMQFTGERPWNPITLDLYACATETDTAVLYEDDTLTTGYQRGEFRKTSLTLAADDAAKTLEVMIGKASGDYPGALARRSWILRFRHPTNWPGNLAPRSIKLGEEDLMNSLHRLPRGRNLMPFGDSAGAPDADTFEVTVPEDSVGTAKKVVISFAPND